MANGAADTVQSMFSAGLSGLSGRKVGIDAKETGKALVKVESKKRQLPQRDHQGKFVERNTGLMLNALGNIYSQLRQLVELTKQSLNIDKKEQLDEKVEKTGAKIDAGETDIPPEIKKPKKGPGILGKMRKGIGSLWAGMGAKTAFAAVVAGLVLLTQFSDELQPHLTKVLIWMRDDMIPAMKELWKDIKGWWFTGWAAVKGFFATMKGIFNSIKLWIKKYDTDASGKIEKDELDKMINDLTDGIIGYIGKYFTDILKTIGGIFLTPTLLGLATKMLRGKVLGTPGVGPLGLGATLGLGIIVTAGVLSLIDANSRAYQDAITDEMGNKQDFDFSEYIGSFLGGSGKGGFFNSFRNLLEKAAIGGAIGFGVAGLVKLGILAGIPLGPIGMATGALAGLVIGGFIGLVTGLIGGDTISEFLDGIGKDIKTAVTALKDFFGGLIAGFKSLFTGDTFAEGFVGSKLGKAEASLAIYEDLYAKMDAESEEAKKYLKETLMPQRAKVAMLTKQLNQVTTSAAQSEEEKELLSLRERALLKELRKSISHETIQQQQNKVRMQEQQEILNIPNIDTGSQKYIDAKNLLAELQIDDENYSKKLQILQGKLTSLLGVKHHLDGVTPWEIGAKKSSNVIAPGVDVGLRTAAFNQAYEPSNRQPGIIMANNNMSTNTDASNKSVVVAPLEADNNNPTSWLAKKKGPWNTFTYAD